METTLTVAVFRGSPVSAGIFDVQKEIAVIELRWLVVILWTVW
jgi:hypothetical protein